MKLLVGLTLVVIASSVFAHDFEVAPILVTHGINDGCSDGIVSSLHYHFNTYVHCFPIGASQAPLASIFWNIRKQGQILCDFIHQDEYFKNGNFSIMGISQGSMLAKYVIEYCPLTYPVRSLVTFGGPHMGVSAVPTFSRDGWLGYIMAWLIDKVIYWDIIQYLLAPADYWRDPQNPKGYLGHSTFLAEANNEIHFNQTRKDLWLQLKYARFIKWADDTTIIPRESAWWGMYTEDYNVVSRFDTEVYQKDLIGIRTLEESGRADFISIPGDHMHFSNEQINQKVDSVFRR